MTKAIPPTVTFDEGVFKKGGRNPPPSDYRPPPPQTFKSQAKIQPSLNVKDDALVNEIETKPSSVTELERLRCAVHYCRTRLKRAAYRDTLDAILRGDKDESIRNPDLTPVVLS